MWDVYGNVLQMNMCRCLHICPKRVLVKERSIAKSVLKCVMAANVPFLPPHQMDMPLPRQTVPPALPATQPANNVAYSPPASTAAGPAAAASRCVISRSHTFHV